MQRKPSKVLDKQQGASSTSNAQNIQSKLLGASVSEISIEKFRTINQQASWFALNGKLNQNILKTISNKFSCDLIFVLDLSNQNLSNIEVLQECIHLVILNLNNNQIKFHIYLDMIRDLFSLQKIDDLMFLSIANNQIHSLDYLGNLKRLTNLQTQQNNLKSLKSVQALERCSSLRTLYLQNLSSRMPKNPLCELDDYRRIMLQTFPQLTRLDGVQTSISKHNTGKELSKYAKSNLKIEISNTYGPWYTHRYPNVETSTTKMDNEFNQTNSECKSLASNIEMKLKLLQN